MLHKRRSIAKFLVVAMLIVLTRVVVSSQPVNAAGGWDIGNIVGLNCGTEIRVGSNLSYPVHTIVPVDNYEVLIQDGPRFEDGQTWWDIDRQAVTGNPGDGTGWISQEQSEAASCSGGGGIIWDVGATIGMCVGTEIRHGPELAIHTIVPEDDWNIVVIDGPRSAGGQTWWDTSRFLAGDPSGGTGWISQDQAEAVCIDGGGSLTYLGPLPLSPEMRALFFQLGYRPFQRQAGDPVNVANGVFTLEATDLDIPGVAGFDLVIKRTYNSTDPRDGVFGVGWTSLLDTGLRINNDASVDLRYPDGRGAFFVLNGDMYEPGQDGIFDELVYTDPGFELITADQMTYFFDQQGYLSEYRDRHGNTISFDRDGDHHIILITDSAGRTFAVSYSGEHIAVITDPLGRIIQYEYTSDDLVSVTDPNGGTDQYGYDDHKMTVLVDPEGIQYLQNIYDGEDRVVEQLDASGSHSYFDYGAGGITTFTDNLGNQTRYYHDNFNRVTQIEDSLGNSEYFLYDNDYNVTSHTNKNDGTWSYTYDARGNKLSESDPLGNTTGYIYNSANDLTGATDALGRMTTHAYNDAGDLLNTQYPDGFTVSATYDAAGQLLTQTDENAHTTAFAYDGEGNLVQIIDSLGNIIGFAYDTVGRRTGVVDANGHTTQNVYDENDNVVEIVDPKSQSTTFEYDLNDNVVRMTDRRGGVWLYGYDENLKLVSEADPEGHVTTHAYDLMYNRISTTDPRGNTTLYRYDAIYQLIEVEDAIGGVEVTAYDPNGNVVSKMDALGFVTTYEYDPLNLLLKQVDALGGATTTTYDAVGNVTSVTNPRGAGSEYEYGLRDRLLVERDALGGEWLTGYDAVGNVTSATDANGHMIALVYDSANRMIRRIDAGGHITEYGYDGAGNQISMTDARGFISTVAFDANDNPISVTDPLGGVTSMVYDEEDNLISQTDPAGHTTQFAYDLDDLLTTRIDAEGYTTLIAYDQAHNQTALTNANGNSWSFEYDELNRRIQQTDPLGGVASYEYDAIGQQIRIKDENGIVTRHDFDDLGRIITEVRNEQSGQPADQETNVIFTYSYDSIGNRVSETDANGNATTYVYDLLDQLISETDAENQVTSYEHDDVGNLTQLTNPRGYNADFTYNADNLPVSLADAQNQVWQFGYDSTHNRTDVVDPHGVVTHNGYDALNRLTAEIRNYQPGVTPDHETNITTQYTYHPDSLRASLIDPKGNTTLFRYDDVHQLVEEEDAQGGIIRFAYDGLGNRLSMTDANTHVTSYEFDALNRMTSMTDPEGHQEAYSFDAVGNLTIFTNGRAYDTVTQFDPLRRPFKVTDALNGETLMAYDAMSNILTLTDQNNHSQNFAYDNVYRLLSHTDAEGFENTFTYDENGNRLTQTDGDGHTTASVYDPLDRLTGTTNAEGETTAYQYDALGNRTAMTENDGVVTRYDHDHLYRLSGVTLNHVPAALPDHETNVQYGYGYDANSNLVSISDPMSHVTESNHDSLNRQVSEINPLGDAWQYDYDPVDNLLERLDANGDLTQYSYFDDDLLQRISYPDGSFVEYVYDANHNRTQMGDSLGMATWTYDELDRLIATTDSLGHSLGHTYDPVGNRIGITYPDGRTVAYTYLDNNWLETVTDPEGGLTSYTRDGAGLVSFIDNPNDTVTEIAYDDANRLLSLVTRQTVGAKKTISAFEYTLDAVGQRVQMEAEYGWRNPPNVTTAYTYDPLRRLIRAEDSEGIWTQYGFDAAGNRTDLGTNDDAFSPRPFDSQELFYSYNDANQLLTILSDIHTGQGPKQESAEKVAQALHGFRHEVAAQRGKHIGESATDDLLAQVDALIADLYSNKPPKASIVTTAIADLRNAVTTYMVSGDIDSDGIENSLLAKLDKADRANSGGNGALGNLQAQTYLYDANGNRINHEFPGPQIQGTDTTYDYENRLLQALDYQMNNKGNRVDRSVTDMLYDGIGRRLALTVDPKVGVSGIKRTEYVFDLLDPVAEYDLWGNHQRNFYRGDLNRMVSMQTFPSEQMFWYAYDGLGSVTGLTRDKGQSVHDYRYDAYGSVIPVNGNWTEPHNHYTYTGEEWVDSLSLLHFYARDYDPVTGVWMQQDTYRGRLPEPMTLHRYGYVQSNPVVYVDSLGFETCNTDPERFLYTDSSYQAIPLTSCQERLWEAQDDANLLLIGAKIRGGKPLSAALFDHYYSSGGEPTGSTYVLSSNEIGIVRSDQEVRNAVEGLIKQAQISPYGGMSISTLVLQDQNPEVRNDTDTSLGDFTLGLSYEPIASISTGEIELSLTFHIFDRYNFNPNTDPFCPSVSGITILCFGYDEATMLEDNDYARPFYVHGRWTERVSAGLINARYGSFCSPYAASCMATSRITYMQSRPDYEVRRK